MSGQAYNNMLTKIKNAVELEASFSMQKAAKEEHDALGLPDDEIMECNTMFDGNWRKRLTMRLT